MSVFNRQISDTLVAFLSFSWEKFPDNEFHKLFSTIYIKKTQTYLFVLYVIIPLDAPYFLCHENKEIIIPKLSSLCATEFTAFTISSVIFSKLNPPPISMTESCDFDHFYHPILHIYILKTD